MKLIEVLVNGKIHRLSERAIELLGLERQPAKEIPINIQKLPPDISIIKIQKREEIKADQVVVTEVKAVEAKAAVVAPVEVKKKEDVIVEDTAKKKRHGRKVGVKKQEDR